MRLKRDAIFVQLAVERGILSAQQIADCLMAQAKLFEIGIRKDLAEVAQEKGFLSPEQTSELLIAVYDQGVLPAVGEYEIISSLGEGAMGRVFKAMNATTGAIVALKMLSGKLSSNQRFIESLRKEAEAAARLNHPNIVRGLDFGHAQGYNYLAMEFVEGENVRDILKSEGVISEDRAIQIAIQVAKALRHAHEFGIIHRDIKPSNIMITKDGVVKLADLGLALDIESGDKSEGNKDHEREFNGAERDVFAGTPHYMSPEQIRHDANLDTRSDIYSFGATLYHIVTGAPPFVASSPSVILTKHLMEEPTPPKQKNPLLSDGICAVIQKMMVKEREGRYQNPAELLDDLTALANGEPPAIALKGAADARNTSSPACDEEDAGPPSAINTAGDSHNLWERLTGPLRRRLRRG